MKQNTIHKTMRRGLVLSAVGLILFNYVNCSNKTPTSSGGNTDNSASYTVDVNVANTTVGNISPFLFGANLNWNKQAHGIIEFGELIRDRSFRQQSGVKKLWAEYPNPAISGVVNYHNTGGDNSPAGGNASAGYMQLSQTAPGFTCIDQVLLNAIQTGQTFDLHFSSYGEDNAPALVAFFTDGLATPISSFSNYIATTQNAWAQHSLSITTTGTAEPAKFRICLASTGSARIDEIRLSQAGSAPQVKALAKSQMQNLKITTLRWPGGTAVDTFIWPASVGHQLQRAELTDDHGDYETPALGLHEFLNLCEELNIEPLIQVNVLDSTTNAANLVEYILGSSATPQGAKRAANGRAAPWAASYFEIGNEPTANYKGANTEANTGANYASLTKAIVVSMRNKANALGKTIYFSGINESSFILADWIAAVPILFNWNNQVFALGSGIRSDVQFTHGHFYTYFGYDADEATRYRKVMSGGEVLRKTMIQVSSLTGNLPYLLTEFHVRIENNQDDIKTEFFKDYQSGLAIAQIYQTLFNQQASGAHFFNFSDSVGFGMTRDSANFYLRPAGVAFTLLSELASATLLSSTVTGAETISITSGTGNIPSLTTYPNFSAVATRTATNKYHIVLINADYTKSANVTLSTSGFVPTVGQKVSYSNSNLSANNESAPASVTLTSQSISAHQNLNLVVPAHSVLRIDLE